MELEPRSAGPVPTMVVAVVGRKESVLEDSDWLTSKLSVGFFSVCLAARKHLLGDSGKWGIKHILLLYRQAVSLGCFPLYFCRCLLLQQVICLSGESGIPLGSSYLCYLIGYWILCSLIGLAASFPQRCAQASSGSPVPLIGKKRRKEKLPLQPLCAKSSTVVVPHWVAWILCIENAVVPEHLIYLCLLELGSA